MRLYTRRLYTDLAAAASWFGAAQKCQLRPLLEVAAVYAARQLALAAGMAASMAIAQPKAGEPPYPHVA